MTDAEQVTTDMKIRALVAAVDDLETMNFHGHDRDFHKDEIKAVRICCARLVKLVARL
jgi:hypothetical protein